MKKSVSQHACCNLYSTRPELETRPTDDVDIVVEIVRYREYAAIEEKLRSKGFVNDVASGIICRYIIQGIIVDVMPTSEEVLGFSNRWYPTAFAKSVQVKLDDGPSISIFSAPYFPATKLEAFVDRSCEVRTDYNSFPPIIRYSKNIHNILP